MKVMLIKFDVMDIIERQDKVTRSQTVLVNEIWRKWIHVGHSRTNLY